MKNKSYIYILVFCLSCALVSCITGKQTKYMQPGDAKYKATGYKQYKLRINDEVSYVLITSDEQTKMFYSVNSGATTSFRIREDGAIYIPTIGTLKIVDMTLQEAEDVVRKAFSSIVSDAEIKLVLVNNYFYVQGDGINGQYLVYKENLNIFQALAMAGDISSTGDKQHIKIIRKGVDGTDYIKTFDLRETSIIESEYYYVQPNDVIYVPTNPNAFFRVDSVTTFISMFVAPISLLVAVLSLLNL